MNYLEILRAKLAEHTEARAAAEARMAAVLASAESEQRADLTDDESAEFDAARSEIADLDTEIDAVRGRIAELEDIERRREAAKNVPQFIPPAPKSEDVLSDRGATPQQIVDAISRAVEGRVDADIDGTRKVLRRHRDDAKWARNLLARSSDVYETAWAKYVTGRHFELTGEERTALSVGTSANGGYLLPTHLDATVILTNDGTTNPIRQLARVETLTEGTTWYGITSAGVSASFDAELTEVSDDSPTFGNPSIDVHKAQAFAQASIEAVADIAGLQGQLLAMFADAKDRLEGSAFNTGSGSDQPFGIYTALDADTTVEIESTTAATIGLVDLHSVYRQVPVRFRGRSSWHMNPQWALAIQSLGTAVSASYSTDITQAPMFPLLGRPVVQDDDAPNTVTTTALDNRLILGDFSNYVIVDKPGSMSVEYIPHMFNTSNNLPDGRRGWYVYWRVGADSVNDVAFRLLQDKTSA